MAGLCPYCNKRSKIRKTCGHPECQYKHHREHHRENFNKFYRKTDRRVSPSILKIKQQAKEVALR
jgi:hypothetical protein